MSKGNLSQEPARAMNWWAKRAFDWRGGPTAAPTRPRVPKTTYGTWEQRREHERENLEYVNQDHQSFTHGKVLYNSR